MTEETKANIGCAFVAVFIALLFFLSWIISDYKDAYESLHQNTSTCFDVQPTEVIGPEYSFISFNWNGYRWVVHKTTFFPKTNNEVTL